jgi:hypothetical protein
MEPAWLQYLQQGVARQLVDFSHHNHPLSSIVNVFNQDRNRELCSRAYGENLATIDLSDASDSVSFELMKRLTHGLPLARYFYACRSHTAMIGGKAHPLVKFAPMGSALCFINECFVFASVVELAYRKHYGEASLGYHSGISVYGDDIICPKEIYNSVVDILTSIGFTVNEQKSYSSGPYYESCGVEYLYGALITTIKHPRAHLLQQKDRVSPDLVGTVTDLANSLLRLGYTTSRRILLKRFERYSVRFGNKDVAFMKLLQFNDNGIQPIVEPYTSTRWDANLQCRTRTQLQCRTTPTRHRMDYHHFQWMMLPRCRAERLTVFKTPKKVIFHSKWSDKAVIFLSRFQHWDLLESGEICENGTCRTGRLRSSLAYHKQSLG